MAQLGDAGSFASDAAPRHLVLVAADRVAGAGGGAVDQGGEAADAAPPHSRRPVPQAPPAKRSLGWWSSLSSASPATRSARRPGSRTASRSRGLPAGPTARLGVEDGL